MELNGSQIVIECLKEQGVDLQYLVIRAEQSLTYDGNV